MIEARGLTRRYRSTLAVDDLTFTVRQGVVTGFLGPNGAGKSTTLRMLLGLERPTAGSITVGGSAYRSLREPLRTVGALLDAKWVHPRRTARAHLTWIAKTHRLPSTRVEEVLGLVGLADVAGKRAGELSLGMSQRLGIAAALLGDPAVLVFDEPANGLDPEGIRWFRHFVQRLAAQGRTVFVSSHLLAEMAQTAGELVVIGRGRLVAQGPVSAFGAAAAVQVRGPRLDLLARALQRHGLRPTAADGGMHVPGATAAQVGEIAAAAGVVLHELVERRESLEEAFVKLTEQDVQYRTGVAA